MKEKARNVKTDRKYWTDPMSISPLDAKERPLGRGQDVSKRGADMRRIERIEKGIKAFRRGGMWYDPMCYPVFAPER